jgi:hypothetical protein
LRRTDTDGVLRTSLKGKKFETLHPGFKFREEEHEASRYLFGEAKKRRKNR